MSIAGGYYKAAIAARESGCECVQIFTKNNNQWRAKPISDHEAELFRRTLVEQRVGHPLSHSSYLINLASPDPDLRKKSVDAFVIELRRADQLGIPYVVLHPGAHMGEGEAVGIKTVIKSLNEVNRRTRNGSSCCLLETTAGQGTCLGWRFEHLAAILDGVRAPDRLGVCLDTCHVFAAGYPLAKANEYRRTMRQFSKLIGLQQIKAFHLNDSKRELGSRVDRHEHIGQGHLGEESFRNLLNDDRFRAVPMYLETPKGKAKGTDCDAANLCKLRSLIAV